MLDAIKKMVGKQEPQAEMLALQTEFSSYKETAEALMAEMQAQLDARTQALAQLEAKIAEYAAQAEAEKAAAQAAAEEAAAKKLQARKASLEHAVGTESAAVLMAALENLGDEQFEVVVGGLAKAVDEEAKSPMFSEAGIDDEVDASKISPQPTHFKQFLPKQ